MNFNSDVIKASADLPILVKFSASFCQPCRTLQPIMEQLQLERSDYKTVYVDVEQFPAIGSEYKINSVPTLILFYDEHPFARINGMMSKTQLNNWLDTNLPTPYTEIK